MKNFKKYDDFLVEFKDNWAAGEGVAGIVKGTFKLTKFLYGKMDDASKKNKLKNLKESYDDYLKSVYQYYLNNKVSKSDTDKDNKELDTTNDHKELGSNNVANLDQHVEPTKIEGDSNKELPEHDDFDIFDEDDEDHTEHEEPKQIKEKPEAKKVKVEPKKEVDIEHEEEEDDDYFDIHSPKYFNSIKSNLEDDLAEVLAIPNPDAKSDYMEWKQKVKDFKQDLRNFVEDITDAVQHIGTDPKKEEYFDNLLSTVDSWFDELKNNGINESKAWNGGSIEAPENWSDKDKEAISKLINPYKIEEFIIKKNKYATTDKLKNEWELLENSIFKKWYYIFNVESLKTKSRSIDISSKGKESKSDCLVMLDYIDESFTSIEVHLSKLKEREYFFFTDIVTGVTYIMYNADKDITKVIGVLQMKEASTNQNVKWSLKALHKMIIFRNKKYNPHVSSDGFICIKLDKKNKDVTVIIDKNNVTKPFKLYNEYVIRKVDRKEVEKLFGGINRPEYNIDDHIVDLFK